MGWRFVVGASLTVVALLGGVTAIRDGEGTDGPANEYQSAATWTPVPATSQTSSPSTAWSPAVTSSSSAGWAPAVTSRPYASSLAGISEPPTSSGLDRAVDHVPGGASLAPVRQPTSGWIATLSAPTAWSSSPGGPIVASLGPTNPYGGPQTLAVVGAPGKPGKGAWLHVELPVRPNGSTGWIPYRAARLTWTSYSIQISLSAHILTLRRGTKVVLRSRVAVGAPSTPTPPDHTYVWELVRPTDPTGAYGPYIFGLAEFSDAYSVFNGGDAQIGIHGSDEPWSVGEAASHGCIRLPNPTVSGLVGVLPLGTPVTLT